MAKSVCNIVRCDVNMRVALLIAAVSAADRVVICASSAYAVFASEN